MRARHVATLLVCLPLLAGCGEYSVVTTTPAASAATLALPPIGYIHGYGNNPVASRDGLTLERHFYTAKTFWEVRLQTTPAAAGNVNVASQPAVLSARHAVTSMILVLATEERGTIAGLLDTGSHGGQEAYAVAMLQVIRGLGYDALSSAEVRVYFSERDEHALLSWTSAGGYKFTVFDNDLKGSALLPPLGGTPLPSPTVPPPPASPPPSAAP